MQYKRIVVKVGTSSLTNPDGSISRLKIKSITQQLSQLHAAGHEVILVTSGAIAAGYSLLGFKKRPTKIADKQACAAVGQGLLLEEYTSQLMVKQIVSAQVLVTQEDFMNADRYQQAHQALSVLVSRGAIPIINENDTVSTAEIKVGDNDTLSAQVAAMMQADLLVLLTDVDGLYTANPATNPDAKRLDYIETLTADIIQMAGGAGSANGTGGMMTKIKAATIATFSGVPVYICSSLHEDAILEAVSVQKAGTFFEASERLMKTQKQWLAFYAKSTGTIIVDEGAARAVTEEHKSLLLSGIHSVDGRFQAHEIVKVQDEKGRILGKGRSLLGAQALQELLSVKNSRGVVIHRDDWVSATPTLELFWTHF